MKKTLRFFLGIICMLTLSGCGMMTNEEDIQTTENEFLLENTVSVNIDDIATQRDSYEEYCDYLGQVTEKYFIGEDGIESADATVTYDEKTGQYSIELSIETDGEVGGEQIELYKSILSKKYEYAKVVLVIDGEVM